LKKNTVSASMSRKQNNMAMNGYLFTAGLTRFQAVPTSSLGAHPMRTFQTWDTCASAIVYGGDAE
jgi:hypothetical protein